MRTNSARYKTQQQQQEEEGKPVRAITFFKKEGWFAFKVVDINESALEEGKVLFSSEPDIFPIFIGQITSKIREYFEI